MKKRFINVGGVKSPIYIKDDKIVVEFNGREHTLFQHDQKAYLEIALGSYLTHGLTIRQQGLIMGIDLSELADLYDAKTWVE